MLLVFVEVVHKSSKLLGQCCCSDEVSELKRQMQKIEVDLKKEVKKDFAVIYFL